MGPLFKYLQQARKIISMSAGVIDMYGILMAAADHPANHFEGGLAGNDWLLDLLDEAQIDDLPPTDESRREDK